MSVSLRSVLFHEVSDSCSTFTAGLGVTVPVAQFRSRIEFLARRYRPVSLGDVRAALLGEPLPPRAVLVTIDDAYASVARVMAPILERYEVPAAFFVNSGFVDHRDLNVDNLVAHVANTVGGSAIAAAAAEVDRIARPTSIRDALQGFVPALTLDQRRHFADELSRRCPSDPRTMARELPLYVSSDELRGLPPLIEIGSHTASHVRCRMLTAEELTTEISGNRSALRALTGAPVDSFSVPYGSRIDRPAWVTDAVVSAGHDLIFLVEGMLNHGSLDPHALVRVSLARRTQIGTLVELELAPRVRRIRDVVRERL